MKVVHVCTSLEGGAGLCAHRIIRSTRAWGIDAKAIVAHGKKSENVDVVTPVYPWSRNWMIRKFQVLQNMRRTWPHTERIYRRIEEEKAKNQKLVTFTSPITLYKELVNHPWIEQADIVHLHWIGDFVDYDSFFTEIKKPILWTIHDENPGLGGFHYQMWKDNAIESFKDFDDELAIVKEKAYSHVNSMTLVAISSMMRGYFERNSLLSRFPCSVIHNGIEEKNFFPISRHCAREALNIPKESVMFLFAAQDIHEDRKGLKELIGALEELKIPNTLLVCLGNFIAIPNASFEIRCEGFVGNNRLQSLYYSAADFFVLPSFQEAFCQTPIEAMACGTPVVAFPCSGASDLINEDNGVVCEYFTADALANGIKTAMSREYDPKIIREDVINRFSYDKIAQQYIELYKKVLAK